MPGDGNATKIGDGVSNLGKFPKLAGQSAAYIVKQVEDFRDGRRHSDEMEITARTLEEQDLHDIAAYYASLPAMRGSRQAGDSAAARYSPSRRSARKLPRQATA